MAQQKMIKELSFILVFFLVNIPRTQSNSSYVQHSFKIFIESILHREKVTNKQLDIFIADIYTDKKEVKEWKTQNCVISAGMMSNNAVHIKIESQQRVIKESFQYTQYISNNNYSKQNMTERFVYQYIQADTHAIITHDTHKKSNTISLQQVYARMHDILYATLGYIRQDDYFRSAFSVVQKNTETVGAFQYKTRSTTT